MSDIMLLGVLRMPVDPATASPIEIMQYVARGQEAADRIEADAVRIRHLEDHVSRLEQAVVDHVGHQEAARSLFAIMREFSARQEVRVGIPTDLPTG